MSWSEAASSILAMPARQAGRVLVIVGLVVLSGVSLGACSFSPVYGGSVAGQPSVSLAFAEPGNRLEQVVYQELSLRFTPSAAATAPLAKVSVLSVAGAVAMSATANPNKLYRNVVTARLVITSRDGSDTAPIVLTRQATAEYTTSGQVLADTAAANDAAERAAKAAAESLRLAVLASLSR